MFRKVLLIEKQIFEINMPVADQTLSEVFFILASIYVIKQLSSAATFEINTVFIASNTKNYLTFYEN